MASPSPLLRAQSLAISVAGAQLIPDFSLELAAGEIVVLRAPSGAGKTTVLRALGGLHPFDSGSLWLRGEEPEIRGWSDYRRRVALVSQVPTMFEGSVRENLALAFTFGAAPGAFPEAEAVEYLAELDLHDALEKPARALSVGEAQRAHLVRSLLLKPEVLLLDEPTSGLDEGRRAAVEARLRAVVAAGATILLVTHEEAQAARLADRVVTLEAGGARADAAPAAPGRGPA